MGLTRDRIPAEVLALIRRGTVIPAHPLALDRHRGLDARRQRALTRYYLDAGAGGLAVGVHATQFAIREAGLYETVLGLAAETADEWTDRPVAMIAGLAGRTEQAVREAKAAVGLGYHAGLLSLGALKDDTEDALAAHCRRVADEIPLVGFYLQPAVGGRPLSAGFWRRFAEIDNAIAVKAAPFNRYRTLDVVRGIVEAEAEDRIAVYTGNDDHIVLDLAVPLAVRRRGEEVRVRIRGGLLGHWSVWTKRAVELLEPDSRGGRKRRHRRRPPRARFPRHRLQRRGLRRRQRVPGLHRRLPRDPPASGSAGRHLVPRSRRDAEPRPGGGNRPRPRRPPRSRRRRFRRREPGALAGVASLDTPLRGYSG